MNVNIGLDIDTDAVHRKVRGKGLEVERELLSGS